MKTGIHPEYHEAKVHCSCGAEFTTGSTRENLKLDVCSQCHPFYSGVQKIVDTAGRVQRFQDKYGDRYRKAAPVEAAAEPEAETAEKE